MAGMSVCCLGRERVSPRADMVGKWLPRPLQVEVPPGPWKAPLLPTLPATAVRLMLPLAVCESPSWHSRGPSTDKAASPSPECIPRWPPSPEPSGVRPRPAGGDEQSSACRSISAVSAPISTWLLCIWVQVSHFLQGLQPCGRDSGGRCPRLSTCRSSSPATGDRDGAPEAGRELRAWTLPGRNGWYC